MYIKQDSNTIVGRAGVKVLGGKFGVAYDYSEIRDGALNPGGATFVRAGEVGRYQEVDVTYKTKVTPNVTMFAGYIHRDLDITNDAGAADNADFIHEVARVWARYNF